MNKPLIIEHLTKSYGPGAAAVQDVSFQLGQGEFVAIIGPSGAGKSTILRCINRMVEPTEGRILFEGQDISTSGPKDPGSQKAHRNDFFSTTTWFIA